MIKFKKVSTYKDQVSNIKLSLKEIGIKAELLKGCYEYQSGFFQIENQWFYFSCSPMFATKDHVLWRTAKHNKDYTGGQNQWCNSEMVIQNAIKHLNHLKFINEKNQNV